MTHQKDEKTLTHVVTQAEGTDEATGGKHTPVAHSPLPWRVTHDAAHYCIRPGQTGWLIAQLREATYREPGWGDPDPSRMAKENAEFIVLAVNHHHELVAALTRLDLATRRHGILSDPERADDAQWAAAFRELMTALEEARAVLAKVGA